MLSLCKEIWVEFVVMPPSSWDWPVLQEGDRRGWEIRGGLAESPQCHDPQLEGEVRGGPEEGDQEAPAASGPDQELDRAAGDQGQVGAGGQAQAYRNGTTVAIVNWATTAVKQLLIVALGSFAQWSILLLKINKEHLPPWRR